MAYCKYCGAESEGDKLTACPKCGKPFGISLEKASLTTVSLEKTADEGVSGSAEIFTQKKKTPGILLALPFIIVIVIGVVLGLLASNDGGSYVGLKLEKAIAKAEKDGFSIESICYEYSDEYKKGKVTYMEDGEDGYIDLWVSLGKRGGSVEDYTASFDDVLFDCPGDVYLSELNYQDSDVFYSIDTDSDIDDFIHIIGYGSREEYMTKDYLDAYYAEAEYITGFSGIESYETTDIDGCEVITFTFEAFRASDAAPFEQTEQIVLLEDRSVEIIYKDYSGLLGNYIPSIASSLRLREGREKHEITSSGYYGMKKEDAVAAVDRDGYQLGRIVYNLPSAMYDITVPVGFVAKYHIASSSDNTVTLYVRAQTPEKSEEELDSELQSAAFGNVITDLPKSYFLREEIADGSRVEYDHISYMDFYDHVTFRKMTDSLDAYTEERLNNYIGSYDAIQSFEKIDGYKHITIDGRDALTFSWTASFSGSFMGQFTETVYMVDDGSDVIYIGFRDYSSETGGRGENESFKQAQKSIRLLK